MEIQQIDHSNYLFILKEMPASKRAFIEKVLADNYEFRYQFKEREHHEFIIKIYLDNCEIAKFPFVIDNKTEFRGENIKVEQNHQHKGMATASYILAEFLLKKTAVPDIGQQTEAAKGFWAQSNRPFGKP